VSVVNERLVRRAVSGLMDAVRRQTGQFALRSGPFRLLPDIGREDKERFPIETCKSRGLAKDGWQLRELDAIGVQFAR